MACPLKKRRMCRYLDKIVFETDFKVVGRERGSDKMSIAGGELSSRFELSNDLGAKTAVLNNDLR